MLDLIMIGAKEKSNTRERNRNVVCIRILNRLSEKSSLRMLHLSTNLKGEKQVQSLRPSEINLKACGTGTLRRPGLEQSSKGGDEGESTRGNNGPHLVEPHTSQLKIRRQQPLGIMSRRS